MLIISFTIAVLELICLVGSIRSESSSDGNSNEDLLLQLREVHPLWLRERCREPFYADPDTRQPKYNLHEEEANLTVLNIDVVQTEGIVFRVEFSDLQACTFPESTIRAELENDLTFLQAPTWGLPPRYIWDSEALHAPPSFEHDDIINESDQMRKFLSALISAGIAVVSNVPREAGECVRFGERFSSLRETEWGKQFNVRSTPDTAAGGVQRKDLAYTANKIGMHVDSPYRMDTPPAFQLLHAIEHCHGPECRVHNRLVDGFAVAAALCQRDRKLFDTLTSVVLRWENNGGDDSSVLFRYAPMIELEDRPSNSASEDACPDVRAINFSAKSGGYAPNMPKDQLELFYKAKREFSELLHSDKFAVRVQLYPGALIIFDNRRVLHSRSQIEDTDGVRWLQGCYLNRDGVYYLYERMRRKFTNLTETPFRNLREAEKSDFDRMGVEYDKEVTQNTLQNFVRLLMSQKDAYLGAPVSLLEHNVQTASRAFREGEDDETIVISLFHDVFETLAVKNHGELAAAMLAPWISPKSQWLLAHHEIFQGFYYFEHYGLDKNQRDMFLDHPFYNWTVSWCEKYDQASFDPDYPSLPLAALMPVVERVLSKPQYWWNPSHPKSGAVSAQSGSYRESVVTGQYGSGPATGIACKDTWTCF